jgi:hypothetical protein
MKISEMVRIVLESKSLFNESIIDHHKTIGSLGIGAIGGGYGLYKHLKNKKPTSEIKAKTENPTSEIKAKTDPDQKVYLHVYNKPKDTKNPHPLLGPDPKGVAKAFVGLKRYRNRNNTPLPKPITNHYNFQQTEKSQNDKKDKRAIKFAAMLNKINNARKVTKALLPKKEKISKNPEVSKP